MFDYKPRKPKIGPRRKVQNPRPFEAVVSIVENVTGVSYTLIQQPSHLRTKEENAARRMLMLALRLYSGYTGDRLAAEFGTSREAVGYTVSHQLHCLKKLHPKYDPQQEEKFREIRTLIKAVGLRPKPVIRYRPEIEPPPGKFPDGYALIWCKTKRHIFKDGVVICKGKRSASMLPQLPRRYPTQPYAGPDMKNFAPDGILRMVILYEQGVKRTSVCKICLKEFNNAVFALNNETDAINGSTP